VIVTLTTAMVGNVITTLEVRVKSIRIIGNGTTAAGHHYRIESPDGLLLWRTRAAGTWYIEESITQRNWYNGYKLIALDSGEIDLETEPHSTQY
jgi:hypothetical protein